MEACAFIVSRSLIAGPCLASRLTERADDLGDQRVQFQKRPIESGRPLPESERSRGWKQVMKANDEATPTSHNPTESLLVITWSCDRFHTESMPQRAVIRAFYRIELHASFRSRRRWTKSASGVACGCNRCFFHKVQSERR